MSDVEQTVEEQTVEFVEQPDEPEVTVEDLQKQINETMEKLNQVTQTNEQLRSQLDDRNTIIKGFEQAAEKISLNQQTVQPTKQDEPVIDKEALQQQFYDDPVTSTEQVATALLKKMQGDKMETLGNDLLRMHLNISKNSVPPKLKEMCKDYEDEVEKLVQTTAPQVLKALPNPYETAYRQVLGNHAEDIMAKSIEEGKGNQNQPEIKKSPPFTEQSSVTAPGNGVKKTVRLTSEMIAYRDRMAKMGMDGDEALRRKYGYGG